MIDFRSVNNKLTGPFGKGFYKFIFLFFYFYFIIIPFVLSEFDIYSVFAFIISLTGALSFFLSYSHHRKFLWFERDLLSRKEFILNVFIMIAFLFIFSSLLGSFVLKDNLVGDDIDYTSSFADNNPYLTILYILKTTFITLFLFFYIKGSRARYWLCFSLSLLSVLDSPTRMLIIQQIIIWGFYGHYFKMFTVKFYHYLLIALCAPFVMLVLLLKRGRGENNDVMFIIDRLLDSDFYDIKNLIVTALESFNSFDMYINIIKDSFIRIENGVLRTPFMFVPRSIWPDKPESISRVISFSYNPSQYNTGGGTVATLFGDMYINGGFIAVILLCGFLGFFSRLIYNTTCYTKESYYSECFKVALYSFFTYYTLHFYRGFFSEMLWQLLLVIMFLFFLRVLFFKRN